MKADYFSTDIQEFLQLLHQYDVQYMIVGGEAVIYYGYPRLTGDIDIFYKNSSKNIHALYEALNEFWDGDIPGIQDEKELGTPGHVIQFGVPPNRIDLLNNIEAVAFEDAWKSKKVEPVQISDTSTPLYIIGLQHLVKNKQATGRAKDRDDLEFLEKLLSD
ncbi:MAG: nucleotidyltransferase [Balneolaceae bacterium]|nr:nucleotidyltransferase [Balneolaceae bacterium]